MAFDWITIWRGISLALIVAVLFIGLLLPRSTCKHWIISGTLLLLVSLAATTFGLPLLGVRFVDRLPLLNALAGLLAIVGLRFLIEGFSKFGKLEDSSAT